LELSVIDMKGLFGYNIQEREINDVKKLGRAENLNPLRYAYGPGEFENKKCKDCIHLYYIQRARRYYKCDLRKPSVGSAVKHLKYWPACLNYQFSVYLPKQLKIMPTKKKHGKKGGGY
jgi:hypothetical protein